MNSALADVSYLTGAGHTTGLSVVYHRVEPLTTVVRESAVGPEQKFEVSCGGAATRRGLPACRTLDLLVEWLVELDPALVE